MRIKFVSFAKNIEDIEIALLKTGMTFATKRIMSVNQSRAFVNSYNVFTHPEAREYIKSGDTLLLFPYKRYEVSFIYDHRLNPPQGKIKLKEPAITAIESSLWVCRRHGNNQYERYYPPLHPDYIPACGICGSLMEVALKAHIPWFRHTLENLPEYAEAIDVKAEVNDVQIPQQIQGSEHSSCGNRASA